MGTETHDPLASRTTRRATATSPSADFAYDGAPGRTRREALHVTMPGGVIQSIAAHRVVNVGTDPDLREPALQGVLHRFESGEELAIVFVYHDPAARKFALVVPPPLRHRELTERARLLEALEADADHPIPGYVRHFAVVVGLSELAEYVDLPSSALSALEAARREAALRDEAARLEALEAAAMERERDLQDRERDLQDREQQLREASERLSAAEADLVARERALEQALAEQAASMAEVIDDDVEAVSEEVEALAGDEVEAVSEADVEELGGAAADAPAEEFTDEVTEVSDLEVQPVEPDTLSSGVPLDALLRQLEDAGSRGEAAQELARRGGPEELEAVGACLGRLTPTELVAVLVALVRRGDDAGEVLLKALRAREPYVRHGAALALGELRPRRAVTALASLVESEPEDLWQEAARVLARFGAPALEALTRSPDGFAGDDGRHAYALAALAEHGHEAEVAALDGATEGELARVATEALVLRPVVRAHAEAIDGRASPEPGDPVRAFSRRFHDALGPSA
jgi:hypothetical protein